MRSLGGLTYGIVGLGIMGGSLAKAIRRNVLGGGAGRLLVCNRSEACLSEAVADGVADGAFPLARVDEMLSACDFVFVCLYPRATLEFLEAHRGAFRPGAVVTDISGVKGLFERELPGVLRDDVDFIIGHPMAGGEKEGYAASDADFFVGRNYILCPREGNSAEHLEEMRSLVRAMGFARITETTCSVHDDRIGFTSQLCHVIASALVLSASDEGITAFGGGSFEDLTRIAMINAPLWTELFVSNRDKLCAHIENFERVMEDFRRAIADGDTEGLRALLSETRERRVKMGALRAAGK